MSSIIELYPGQKDENICTLGCPHCSNKWDGKSKVSSYISDEQNEIFQKTQEILSLDSKYDNHINLVSPIDEFNLELEINKKYNLDSFDFSIKEIGFYKNTDPKILLKTIFSNLDNILGNNIEKITSLGIGIPLKNNFFDLIDEKSEKINEENLDLVYSFLNIYIKTLCEITDIQKNISFASNFVDSKYLESTNEMNYANFYDLIHHILKENNLYSSNFQKYNELYFSKDIGLVITELINPKLNLSFVYRLISKDGLQKNYNSIEKDECSSISIHQDRIQFEHSTHNINNPNFWFSFEEYNKLIEKKLKNKSVDFREIYIKELFKRGIEFKK